MVMKYIAAKSDEEVLHKISVDLDNGGQVIIYGS